MKHVVAVWVLIASLSLLVPASVTAAPAASQAGIAAQPYLSQPALSPDATEIAFVSGGDIWTVAASGGAAQLLVGGEPVESRPLYSPDGQHLAFISTRSGNGDIHVLDFTSGDVRRITWDDGFDNLSAWSADGEWLYFSSARDNVAGMNGVYRVRASGGTPMPVSLEAYRNHEGGAPSPDGRDLALVGAGTGERYWWRNGHSNLETGAIWLLRDDGQHRYQRVTPDDARALWPMWSADGAHIYYMSDRGGAENLWRTSRTGDAVAVTAFNGGRVLWPSMSAQGKRIAFERDFRIWTLDIASGVTAPVAISLRGAAASTGLRHERYTSDFSDLQVSPDGKKVAVIVRGEVFATAAEKGGRAHRVTRTAAAELHPAWAPDSRRLIYSSERDGNANLYLYDFASSKEIRLTDGVGQDLRAQFSPDGRHIAFVRDGQSLHVLDPVSGKQRQVVAANIDLNHPLGSDRPFAWSPDSRMIAFQAFGKRMFRNTSVVDVASAAITPVSFLANVGADSVTWSADGKALYFSTGQRTETGQVARVDLVAQAPRFAEAQFRSLFDEDAAEEAVQAPRTGKRARSEPKDDDAATIDDAAPNVRVDAQGLRERLALLPIGLDVGELVVSPDGKSLLLTARTAGQGNLYLYSIDPLAREPAVPQQLTSSTGHKRAAQFSADGKSIYYLESGKPFVLDLADKRVSALTIEAGMDIDFEAEKWVMFDQAWRWLRDGFHDPHMNGVDWNAVRSRYAPLLAGARNVASMRDLLNLMVGELNASHTGVRLRTPLPLSTGRLGLRWDRAVYERTGRLQVSEVLRGSAADVEGSLRVGDIVQAIDGVTLDARSNLDQSLSWRSGQETVLGVSGKSGASATRDVRLKPLDARSETALAYRAWVTRNRAHVAKASGGRLGYVHIADMSMASLQRLFIDLDADNANADGVVIDVRNNFGGFVNAYALDVFARQPYLNMRFRGMPTASARSLLGQRSLERPSVLLTNRTTLSDGEDFSEGYRRLGLGKIVGEPTSGWIIFTSNTPMLDGSLLRIPFSTITTHTGEPMEMQPRPVDVPAERALGEAYRNADSVLDTAVQTLLQDLAAVR